ncbi:MAG: hypothetical protein DMG75_11780 [Acidobacteria bacterium]|nr:MAG: hypothetical protein DMG75_11780 [Acidobacteriota bacterium]
MQAGNVEDGAFLAGDRLRYQHGLRRGSLFARRLHVFEERLKIGYLSGADMHHGGAQPARAAH